MKIYFAGSIRGGGNDSAFYKSIIEELRKYGEIVGGEHADDKVLSALDNDKADDKYIYERDNARLNEADVLVAEVTTPSLGVGYELGRSVEREIEVLTLFKHQSLDKKLSAMINGCPKIIKKRYTTIEDISVVLEEFFNLLIDKS